MAERSTSDGAIPAHDVQATFCEALVDEWIRQGARHAVLAPGSRSTPMALALTRAASAGESISLDVFHDERSAAFAALGTALVSGRPAIVLCTSGTAAAHFHAAVIEADLSAVPMIVCTADRPPELRDVGAPQTIDQTKMFADAVRWFHDPGVPSIEGAPSWRSLASRVYWSAAGDRPGPVHLNLPFREPLVGTPIPELIAATVPSGPTRLRGPRHIESNDIVSLASELSGRSGVIIAGRGCGRPGGVETLARALGWPVIAEPRSGCGGGAHTIAHADALVRVMHGTLVPEVILRLGEPPSSKAVSQWVTASEARQIHASGWGQMYDPDHRLDLRIETDVDLLLGSLAEQCTAIPADVWFERWWTANAVVAQILDEMDGEPGPWTGIQAARSIVRDIPPASHLVISSSMPIRDVEWFAGDCSHLTVHANRGANGIDGVLATAAGVARGSGRPTFVLLGDVAAIHDASTLLSLSGQDLDLRIIVLNNDGGGIFHHLPQAATVDEGTFEAIYGTPHGIGFSSLARALGMSTWEIGQGDDDLRDALTRSGPTMIEIRTRRDTDLAAHRTFHESVAVRLKHALD